MPLPPLEYGFYSFLVQAATWEGGNGFWRCVSVSWLFGGNPGGKKQGESPWWHLSATPEWACGLFSSISSSHSFLSTVASALHWEDRCSRVLAVPAPQMLVAVLTTPGRACKRNSMVNLYQDFDISILFSVGGCSFTSPSHHHWRFPDEALWFHPLCPSASSVPSCNPYRWHTSSPDPMDTPAWDLLPRWRVYLEGVVHMQLHRISWEGLLFASHKSLQTC